jgi:betaine lipid synthase
MSVPENFSEVYLVDLSPSLCAVARKRFEKLGFENVHVVCMDARSFRLDDNEAEEERKADWISMSYSLSMIPE